MPSFKAKFRESYLDQFLKECLEGLLKTSKKKKQTKLFKKLEVILWRKKIFGKKKNINL